MGEASLNENSEPVHFVAGITSATTGTLAARIVPWAGSQHRPTYLQTSD